jgi:heat shock protein HspQ
MIQINKSFGDDDLPDAEPRFVSGAIVRHRRYGYRGVVVSADGHCKAAPKWYMSNKTQPDREQSWYHVLVHESNVVTYAAESSLTSDESEMPIEHPLVAVFFTGIESGSYIRNDTAWPG